jgi:hypothetical protein
LEEFNSAKRLLLAGVEHSLSGTVGPGGMPSWTPPPAMQSRDGGGIAPALPAVATTQGAITAAPAASAAPAPPAAGAAMATGLATVLAKLDALLSAIKSESGFLEKVLT